MQSEFDVVVVGSGLAGLSAAMTVAEAGLSVLVLEKQPYIGGTSLKSNGAFNAVDARRQIRLGVEDSPEKHWMQAWEVGKQKGRVQLLKTMTYEAGETLRWLEGLGVRFRENVSQEPGSRFPRTHLPMNGNGKTYIRVLSEGLSKFRVPILTGKVVKRLVKDRFGRVGSVQVETEAIAPAQTRHVQAYRARLGIVLAAGGFAGNPDLLHLHGPGYRLGRVLSDQGSTGEVMLAAADIGAGLIGMPFFAVGFQTTAYCLPDDPSKFILLNQDAKRFIREDSTQEKLLEAVFRQKGAKAWLVCHGQERTDESISIAFREKLIDETQRYSRLSLVKQSDPLGKNAALIKAIGKPYCISQLYPTILTSLGGLEIDTFARVIGRDGNPIRGLVAAGDIVGGLHGEKPLYGDTLAAAASFGRIAARTLIREA